MLQPFITVGSSGASKPSINLKTLLRWLAQMQGAEIELGGFRGRTNKLVDGCYSWWVGGSFALLEALGVGGSRGLDPEHGDADGDEEAWYDVDGSFIVVPGITEVLMAFVRFPF
jgi:protein farnesyltransferase subunit beta